MSSNTSSPEPLNLAAHGRSAGLNGSAVPPVRNGAAPLSPAAEAARRAASIPREHTYRVSAFLIVGDWLMACAGIFAGLQLREAHRGGWSVVSLSTHTEVLLTLSSLVGGTIMVWLMALFGSYESRDIYRVQKWFKSTVYSIIITSIAALSIIGFFNVTDFAPRIGIIYCMVATLLLLTMWRLSAFMFLMRPEVREAVSTRIIVVGWNEKVAHLRKAMRRDVGHFNEIVGCVPIPGGRFATKPPSDLAVLGDYSGLATYVAECHAHSVILADMSCPSREIHHLIAFCQRELIGFRMVPEYFPALTSGLQIELVNGVPLLSVSQLPLDRTLNRALKRGVDIVGGLIGLALAAVIVPIFGAIVYAQSPGPIIYPQRRTSRNGCTFLIYKIRSMRMNAEETSGAVWSKRDDPRRLKIGVFMRKYNIDEIPQFWNVVKGDMSLVGPRPERPELIAKFKEHIPNYNARHEVRAGITGWAQINGLRGDCDLGKRIAADLYYLENWSLLLDLHCIVGTFTNNKNAG